MQPDVGLFPRPTEDISLVEFATRGESLEYESVWIGEGWDHDIFVKLSEIAMRTDSITLGGGIANVYTRTPTVLSMAARSLHRLSDGRFILGIGASHPEVVEKYHGLQYEHPIRRLEETVEIIRLLTEGGERVSYEGELFQLTDVPTQSTDLSIYNAAIGPTNRVLTGRLFDGWIPYGIPLPALERAAADVRSGTESSDRPNDAVEVVPWITAAVSEDGETAREAVRQHITTFVSRFDAYKRAFGQEYPDESEVIFEAVADDDIAHATAQITDEMVETFGIAGKAESARTQLRSALDRQAIDHIVLVPPRAASDTVIETTVTELAPCQL